MADDLGLITRFTRKLEEYNERKTRDKMQAVQMQMDLMRIRGYQEQLRQNEIRLGLDMQAAAQRQKREEFNTLQERFEGFKWASQFMDGESIAQVMTEEFGEFLGIGRGGRVEFLGEKDGVNSFRVAGKNFLFFDKMNPKRGFQTKPPTVSERLKTSERVSELRLSDVNLKSQISSLEDVLLNSSSRFIKMINPDTGKKEKLSREDIESLIHEKRIQRNILNDELKSVHGIFSHEEEKGSSVGSLAPRGLGGSSGVKEDGSQQGPLTIGDGIVFDQRPSQVSAGQPQIPVESVPSPPPSAPSSSPQLSESFTGMRPLRSSPSLTTRDSIAGTDTVFQDIPVSPKSSSFDKLFEGL